MKNRKCGTVGMSSRFRITAFDDDDGDRTVSNEYGAGDMCGASFWCLRSKRNEEDRFSVKGRVAAVETGDVGGVVDSCSVHSGRGDKVAVCGVWADKEDDAGPIWKDGVGDSKSAHNRVIRINTPGTSVYNKLSHYRQSHWIDNLLLAPGA
ncbi:hypothetical protein JB92DRAFT_2827319 [Gautieria morchelliformis]|nr:hypothetical protein JB92DRAFT_2827319 [Gautieria morchelliformis]